MDDILTNLLATPDPLSATRIGASVFAALVFGVVLSWLYYGYYRADEPADHSIARSFPLMTPAVAMIFCLIQFSLPLSLGLLGALSFVRFRSPVKRAEDIGFILVMIAVGLSCALLYIHTAIILLVAIALVAAVRHTAPRLLGGSPRAAVLITVHVPTAIDTAALFAALEKPFGKPVIISHQAAQDLHSVVFSLTQHEPANNSAIIEALASALGEDCRVDIYFPGSQTSA